MGHPFHNHSLKIVGGHDHSRLRGKPLHMRDSGNPPEYIKQAVFRHNRIHLVQIRSVDAGNHDIRPHAYHFVAHLMLEADDNRHRNDHHSQPDRNAGHRNADSRL